MSPIINGKEFPYTKVGKMAAEKAKKDIKEFPSNVRKLGTSTGYMVKSAVNTARTGAKAIGANVGKAVSGAAKSVKSNYGYFKAGRKAEFDEENARIKASNIKRLKGE